jgi:hypothetical protein
MKEEFYVYGRDISEWDKKSNGIYLTYYWLVEKYAQDWIPVNKMYEVTQDNEI